MYAHIHNFRFTGNTPTQSHQLEVHAWTPGLKKQKNPLSPRTKASSQLYFSIWALRCFLKSSENTQE